MREPIPRIEALCLRDVQRRTCLRIILRIARRYQRIDPVITTFLENKDQLFVVRQISRQQATLKQPRCQHVDAKRAPREGTHPEKIAATNIHKVCLR